MAFLDNSGDIILDAVLTDTGRMRLAKGDGSFRVAKFALGDDEIDYSLYNSLHASGTAYFDLEILQTPVMEAFSNNASSMKSKLLSITKNNLLYLPVIKADTTSAPFSDATALVNGGYVLAVDTDTERMINDKPTYSGNSVTNGALFGRDVARGAFIKVDQGLDTTEVPVGPLDADLIETQYLIEIDNRFASIVSVSGERTTPSYIDDDNIATYYFSRGVDVNFVEDLSNDSNDVGQVIAGPRGTTLKFKLAAQNEVSTSDYLFNTLGTDITSGWAGVTVTNVRGVLTNVRVTGVTTGNVLDIPLMVIKKIAP
jgi:hypothetical protein